MIAPLLLFFILPLAIADDEHPVHEHCILCPPPMTCTLMKASESYVTCKCTAEDPKFHPPALPSNWTDADFKQLLNRLRGKLNKTFIIFNHDKRAGDDTSKHVQFIVGIAQCYELPESANFEQCATHMAHLLIDYEPSLPEASTGFSVLAFFIVIIIAGVLATGGYAIFHFKVKKRAVDDATVTLHVSDEEETATISFPNPLFEAPFSLE